MFCSRVEWAVADCVAGVSCSVEGYEDYGGVWGCGWWWEEEAGEEEEGVDEG